MDEYEVKAVGGPRRTPKPIDYDRMNREWPKQKAALTRAVSAKDPVKVAEVCIAAVQVWDEVGAWPDDWAAFQRALDDVLPWPHQANLDDVAYGRVLITRKENNDG